MIPAEAATLSIAALATAGVITRPFAWPEAIWAVAGALALALLGLMPLERVAAGIARGTDVYLFLGGMMLLAEVARQEGLFDWLAAFATRLARGSTARLFLLVYGVGVIVTVFLSNDATAVVLTPAVAAAARAARVERPLPYLVICAFVANAASFVLPISNPANLVVYGKALPPLRDWLGLFALPSLVSILATYAVLRLFYRRDLAGSAATDVPLPDLPRGAVIAALGIAATALGLMVASALHLDLGWPTAVAGLATFLIVAVFGKAPPVAMLRDISWGVLPLVAGLFVLVEALEATGVFTRLVALTEAAAAQSTNAGGFGIGIVTALACNLVNNLPAGLMAGSTLAAAQVPPPLHAAALIGIDLGPNLSVTGSLATILWLTALRREGQMIGAWPFLKLGMLVMPPALLLALAALLLPGWL
jgi:arsenical pump membrane protein